MLFVVAGEVKNSPTVMELMVNTIKKLVTTLDQLSLIGKTEHLSFWKQN